MSDVVKLSAKLPADPDTNGLDDLHEVLITEPDTTRVALVWLDVGKITHDVDQDLDVPTVRVRRIEPVGTAENVDSSIRDVVQSMMEQRTGRTPLPFDTVTADTQLSTDDVGDDET